MEYTTESSRRLDNFNKKVNEMIQLGWVLHGGVSVGGNARFETDAQALTKKTR